MAHYGQYLPTTYLPCLALIISSGKSNLNSRVDVDAFFNLLPEIVHDASEWTSALSGW